MKICVAQARPIKGDIPANIEGHRKLIELALADGADAVFFPELSLVGYEPALSKELVTDLEDRRLNVFQNISDANGITIGVGLPIRADAGVLIGMPVFQPHKPREMYAKQYLHADEEPFFVGGQGSLRMIGDAIRIAPAICYEISVPEHAEAAARRGASMYVACVAKLVDQIDAATARLSEIAREHNMTVMMANCVGESGGGEWAGATSVWTDDGSLSAQLDEASEGILIFDTQTKAVTTRQK